MKYSVVDSNNTKVSDITLGDHVFGIEPNQQCIYDAVKNTLANKRQGTSSSLTRSEVQGSTKKPWRQKGTGRARVGTKRTPLWKGGGIIFGPKQRDYTYRVPSKIRQKAFCSVFSQFVKDKKMIIVDTIEVKEVKTKEMSKVLEKLTSSKKVLYIMAKDDSKRYENVRLSSRNISWVKVVNVDSIEINDLFYSDEILVEKSAVEKINSRYTK